ncbi:MAG: serine/threonine-protein kinase [Planctomycetota bacterium]|jgi:predicted Ser/Thr protein kinase
MAAPGTRIGAYEVLGELGRGGMGVVLRVRRADLQRDFALKVILPGKDTTPEALERFRREARAAARLAGHPGIVGVHDIGEEDGKVFFAMDLVEGASLDRLIDEGELSPRRVAKIIAQAARALQHAHSHGVLHRDVKPGNILVTEQDDVRITDFGLAQTQDSTAEASRLTQAGAVLGTPAYLSPEQANGDELDVRADVYSLGATLYEALTGEPPFAGDTVYTVLARIQRDEPKPPRKADPRVPRDLETVTLKCIEKAPDRRYQSCKELADDLERYLNSEPISARPATLSYRMRKKIGRHPVAWALGTLAAVGLAVVGGMASVVALRSLDTSQKLQEETLKKALAEWANLIAGGVPIPTDNALPPLPGEPTDPVERRLAKVKRVSEALVNKDRKYESVRIHQAWLGLARFYAGEQAGLPAMQDAHDFVASGATEDPFPPLLLGRARLAAFLYDLRLPAHTVSGDTVAPGALELSPAQQTLCVQAVEALKVGSSKLVWKKLQHSREYVEFAAGATALCKQQYEAADRRFAPLKAEPILKAETAALRGVALYLRGEFKEAAASFGKIIARKREQRFGQKTKHDRGWPIAYFNRAASLAALAEHHVRTRGTDSGDHRLQAIADYLKAGERFAKVKRAAEADDAFARALALAGDDAELRAKVEAAKSAAGS